jgi:hypothetical protein
MRPVTSTIRAAGFVCSCSGAGKLGKLVVLRIGTPEVAQLVADVSL